MTRTRKATLSVKEFSHLVSESLDMANAPHSLIENTAVVSESHTKSHTRLSSFQRIFSRPTLTPTAGQCEDSPEDSPEDLSEAPRKMIGWPFSRSPRRSRPTTKDEDHPTDVDPDGISRVYSVPSLATSTSSLGSIVPVHERLFQVSSGDFDEPGYESISSSPVTISPPALSRAPDFGASTTPRDAVFGNGPAARARASSSVTESSSSSYGGTERASTSFDEDPTPRATTFGSRATLPSAGLDAGQRRRPHGLSLVVPSRNVDILALRPAIGVAPHAPSETESSVSLCSTSPPTSPVAPRPPSPTFPPTKSSESDHLAVPSNVRISVAQFPGIPVPSNFESMLPVGISPRQRKRALSRSQTPPPSPRPPPTGPLPAVPPVPPLPPLLSKMSMNGAVSSSPRSTMVGGPATAPPLSPPGGLRLPSRLSWVNSVRAVLPSPPASPTKSLKSLAGKTAPHPISPEMNRPTQLKRPTSIGVLEAADNVQVRRTKSILLLGSRSKSTASLGPKRVQIRADAHVDQTKVRRQSSAATVGADFAPLVTPMPSSELLVLRERRHSAPVLSCVGVTLPMPSPDWTLSLPFCTDVPGQQITPSPSLGPQPDGENVEGEVEGEDWTLCMPLKVRASTERQSCEGTIAETEENAEAETRCVVQLPTPSPSPVSAARPLEEEEEEESEVVPEERPTTPASLGPHAGGLDLAGGRGKRASGWYVHGWFDEVQIDEDTRDDASPTTSAFSDCRAAKNHVMVFRKTHGHPSQDSMSTVSTSGATFYSARSSLMVN